MYRFNLLNDDMIKNKHTRFLLFSLDDLFLNSFIQGGDEDLLLSNYSYKSPASLC